LAKWCEFDLKEKLCATPAERRRTLHDATEPHIVPLTELHIGLLDQVRDETLYPDWLFQHKDRNQTSKADALYQSVHRFCNGKNIEHFAPRDCRRTFKTLARSIGISIELGNRLQILAASIMTGGNICQKSVKRWKQPATG
jgi:integrase